MLENGYLRAFSVLVAFAFLASGALTANFSFGIDGLKGGIVEDVSGLSELLI